MTQAQEIKDWMEKHGWITPLEALRFIGCFRLAARILDLKRSGVPIESKKITDPETGKVWSAYRIQQHQGGLF